MAKRKLIIKDDHRLSGTIALGWRVYPEDGDPYDLMWGNTRNHESLQRLVHDIQWRKCERPIMVVDERVKTRGDNPLVVPHWWSSDLGQTING